MTHSNTNSNSFTRTNAKYLASKIAANLKRIQRFYNEPSDEKIEKYELEAIELLNAGYAKKVIYGFKRGGTWIPPTVIYTIKDLQKIYSTDDDPGEIELNADVSGASFYSFLVHSEEWNKLTKEEQQNFEDSLALKRSPGFALEIGGELVIDHNYNSGNESLQRSTLKTN